MPFRQEPPFTHGTVSTSAVVLVNLGTPDAPTRKAVRRYLKEFLSDPRVVEIPRLLWWCILNIFILPFRSGQSAKKYATIWSRDGSPLKVHTQAQTNLLRAHLAERGHGNLMVTMAMRYGSPSLPEVLDKLKADGVDRIAILPAYPQYSATTTGSIYDAVFAHYAKVRNVPELRLVKHYHDHEAYIDALCKSIEAHWDAHGRADKLVMSFHGIPKRSLMLGDPYHCECYKTARLVATQLQLAPSEYLVTFQSRFGRTEWLQPYTAPTLVELAQGGLKRVDLVCPGFTSDCLETLEEIALEAKQAFLAAGGQEFQYIACLNESPRWISALGEIAETQMIGWPTLLCSVQLEAQQGEASLGRAQALALGATN